MKRQSLARGAAFFCLLAIALNCGVSAEADLSEDRAGFALNNPDGQKYDFVKTYIMALEYLYQNEQAKNDAPALIEGKIKDPEALNVEGDRLKTANVNLRIAGNLLENFQTRDNGLMLKIADLFGDYANEETTLNNRHRTVLALLHEAAIHRRVSPLKQRWYASHLSRISKRRKANADNLLAASMLISKLLVSHHYNDLGKFHQLGVTADEREKLLFRLDAFKGEAYQGNVRAGQSYLQASVSSIREILTDENWPSL